MNSHPDYIEYMVKQKVDTSLIMKRVLLVAAIAVVSITAALILFAFIGPAPLFACVAIGAALIYFFWKYFDVSFEYTINGEIFDMDRILSGRIRKKVISVKITDMKLVAPYRGIFADEFARLAPAKKFVCCSSLASPDLYFAVFVDRAHDDRQSAVFFDCTPRTIQLMRRSNPRAVKTGDEVAVNY